jgi:sirohydrochlorin cobaltochelatase
MVRTLRDEVGRDRVRLAYMELATPTLRDVVEELAQEGIPDAAVLPLFLTVEGHVDRDIRPVVGELRAAFPTLKLEMLPPMGHQPEFRRALGKVAERVASGQDRKEEVARP